MVLENMLTQLSLPEPLAKDIEEFAGICRFPGYKKLRESLQPMLDEYPNRWGGGVVFFQLEVHWQYTLQRNGYIGDVIPSILN